MLVEQKLHNDWISLMRRAAPLDDGNTLIVEVNGQMQIPDAVPARKDIVLVWHGLSEDAVHAAIQEVDKRPYAAKARFVPACHGL